MHKTLVIKKEDQSAINLFCNNIGAEGETFTVPLYTNIEHTHYWAGWNVTQSQYESILNNTEIQIFDSGEEALLSLSLRREELNEV